MRPRLHLLKVERLLVFKNARCVRCQWLILEVYQSHDVWHLIKRALVLGLSIVVYFGKHGRFLLRRKPVRARIAIASVRFNQHWYASVTRDETRFERIHLRSTDAFPILVLRALHVFYDLTDGAYSIVHDVATFFALLLLCVGLGDPIHCLDLADVVY